MDTLHNPSAPADGSKRHHSGIMRHAFSAVRAVTVEEMAWGSPLADYPRVFASCAKSQSNEGVSLAPGAPAYDIILGADLLYNPSLYPLLLPTVLELLALDARDAHEHSEGSDCKLPSHQDRQQQQQQQPPGQLGSHSAVVYMCYMERGGEDAFFAAAKARGVVCDQPALLAPLRSLAEDLGCVMVRMRNAKAGPSQSI